MEFNFENVKAAEEGKPMTLPGTTAIFNIEDIEFKQDNNGKEFFLVTFARNEDSFREYYYLTEKAAERFVYLYEKVMGTDSLPEQEEGIIRALKGKPIALKVSGNVNPDTGKGYPSLSFSGYARPVSLINELSFNSVEKRNIEEALEAQRRTSRGPTPTDDNVVDINKSSDSLSADKF